jgi:hypothetical protein
VRIVALHALVAVPRSRSLKRAESSPPSSSLSPHRAFVVQWRAETDMAVGRLVGRVEHVVSGHATTFQTLEGLLAFLARMIAERAAGPPEEREADDGA